MSINTARAIIVEDEQEFQIALSVALEQLSDTWSSTAYSRGQDALNFISVFDGKLDLALVDLGLPDIDGVKVISKISARFPSTPILVVTTNTHSTKLKEALYSGATGYILKDDEIFDLVSGINLALKGHSPINTAMARDLLRLLPSKSPALAEREILLSKRESELLALIAEGLSYDQAANAMDLKTTTIHSYSRNLFRKLGVHSQRQAIIAARNHGII